MESFKVRIAAISALRSSLGILLTTIAMVPALSIIHRVFNGTWYVNWPLMLSVSGILTGCFFSFFFIAQLLEISTASRREWDRQLIFPGVMWVRGIYLLSILMEFTIMVGTYKEGDPWWDVVLPFGFVLLGFFAWPRTIQISEVEIRQRRPLLDLKRIAYGEVENIIFDTVSKEAIVLGKNGEKIVHTMMHADKERFIKQVESLTGKEVIIVGGKSL
jgi:hypothetical protein